MRKSLLGLMLLAAVPAHSQDGEVRLLTDDAIPRYLSRGQELARAEQWEKVVDVLQRVVVGDKEVFPDLKPEVLHSAVYSADGRVFYPARELCLKELARLPPAGLRAYRDAFDREARDVFERADRAVGIRAKLDVYTEVFDKYLPSTVGDDALEAAGDLHLAVGRFYEALAMFRRLVDLYPKDTDRDVAMILTKAAFCAAQIGDHEHRNVLLERVASEYPDKRLRIEGRLVASADLKAHPLLAVRGGGGATFAPEDWPVAGGSASRSRLSEDLPDTLPRQPFWSYRIAEREPKLRAMYGDWIVFMHDRAPSARPRIDHLAGEFVTPYPTVRPVIHDGMVFYKDYLEIVGRNLGSGALAALRMRYRLPDSSTDPQYLYPVTEVRPRPNDAAAAKLEAAYRYLDYGGNALVVGGGMVLALECREPPMNLTDTSRTTASPPNTIVAYSRKGGKMVWSWHPDYCSVAVSRDPALYKKWRADFEAHPTPVFQGPGVIHGRLLYTLAAEREEMAGMSLWAFDIHTGMVRFRTPLHYPDEINGLLPRGASLAVAGGVVYVISHSGVVAAVDALPPGRVRWITRYGRNLTRATGGRRGRRNARGAQLVKQGFAYNEPLVAGGKVFIAPADGKEIVALDAETGVVAWSASKQALGRIYQMLGVVDGVLVVAGDKVLGIDAAKGEKVWGPVDLEGWSHGRGILSEKYAYLPTHHDGARRSLVERIDVRTGVKSASLEFDVEKLGNLLVSDGRLIAANSDQIMCFTTRERELARIDRKLAGAAAKRDLLHERAMVQLTGAKPDRQAARADFDRALAATAAEGEELLLRANALENLFAIAAAGNDLATLDRARELVAPLAAMKRPDEESSRHQAYLAQISLLEAQVLGRLGRGKDSLAAIERFLGEHGHGRVVMANRVVEAAAAAMELRAYLLANNEEFRTAFTASVRARIRAAFERGDKTALAGIPARYGSLAPSEEASFALCDLHERDEEWGRAEIALRRFIEGQPEHERRAYAHLRLARLLARAGLGNDARRERDEGLSRLDDEGRATHAGLIAELEKFLPSATKPAAAPGVDIPLAGEEIARNGAPVPLAGTAPPGMTLFADVGGYTAYDDAGKVLWRRPFPAGAVSPGPSGDSATMVVAAAIARARLAQAVGDDLVLADVGGVLRVEAATGKVRWRYPAATEHAAAEAQRSLELLRTRLQQLKTTGAALRTHPLPGYAIAGDRLIRAAPRAGVEALDLESGASLWVDGPVAATPVGPPGVFGQLVAVGWTKPGLARVYDIVTGKAVAEHAVDAGGVLLAPPVLDPLGRLLLVTAPAADGRGGALRILSARTLRPSTDPVPAMSATAQVLHADGALVVYHDGGSAGAGSQNLHFIDLKAKLSVSRRAPTLLGNVDVLRAGDRLFVFTYDPGAEDTGARLYRIDLAAMDVLAYGLPPRALAYARPTLTRRYVVTLSALARSAHVRFYDRDASADSLAPQAVFLGAEGREVSELDYLPGRATRYEVPPSVSVRDGRVFIGQPFGAFKLQARDTR